MSSSSNSSSSLSTEWMSFSSSTEFEWLSNTHPFVAMASRAYGEGRILIHTDRIGAFQTGHTDNPNGFWRKILEWVSSKKSNELIKVGLIVNIQPHNASKINSLKPLKSINLNVVDLATKDISDLDCLYFVGLPNSITSNVAEIIGSFVENGGGLIIENPNRGQENINVLSDIESLYCYSAERLIQSYAYWTLDGVNGGVYYPNVNMSFMSSMRQYDFSNYWTILMSDVINSITTTTTTGIDGKDVSVNGKASSVFSVSFLNSFQNGIVTLQESPYELASSSSSSSSDSSSSSLSSSSSSTWLRTSSSSSSSSSSKKYSTSSSSSSSSSSSTRLKTSSSSTSDSGSSQSESSSSSSSKGYSDSSPSYSLSSSSGSTGGYSESSSSSSYGYSWRLASLLPAFWDASTTGKIVRWAVLTNDSGHTADLISISNVLAFDEIFCRVGNYFGSQSLANCIYTTGIGSGIKYWPHPLCTGSKPRSSNWTLISSVPSGSTITLGLYRGVPPGGYGPQWAYCSGSIRWKRT